MNKLKTLAARQEATRKILADTITDLKDEFNPIIGVHVPIQNLFASGTGE